MTSKIWEECEHIEYEAQQIDEALESITCWFSNCEDADSEDFKKAEALVRQIKERLEGWGGEYPMSLAVPNEKG